MNKKLLSSLLPIFILAFLFIFSSYLGSIYGHKIEIYLLENNNNFAGYFIYIGLMILATVVAPLSTSPFMPIATSIWGAFTTAILSFIGWSIGSIWAFQVSRKYGLPVVEKFVSKEKIESINQKIPEHGNLLVSIILLRMIVPVDILSYTLGLFPKVKWRPYIIGSIIGVIPFSFIFAYLGGLSITNQIVGFFLILSVLIYIWSKKKLMFF